MSMRFDIKTILLDCSLFYQKTKGSCIFYSHDENFKIKLNPTSLDISYFVREKSYRNYVGKEIFYKEFQWCSWKYYWIETFKIDVTSKMIMINDRIAIKI